jgi:hypothetical protein
MYLNAAVAADAAWRARDPGSGIDLAVEAASRDV